MTIRLIRGDGPRRYRVSMTARNGAPVPFMEGDKLYFTVKTHPEASRPVLQKLTDTFDGEGRAVVTLYPEDRRDLAILAWPYVFDMEVRRGAATATIVPTSEFILMPEVTAYE